MKLTSEERQAWDRFYAAALPIVTGAEKAARLADEGIHERRKREPRPDLGRIMEALALAQDAASDLAHLQSYYATTTSGDAPPKPLEEHDRTAKRHIELAWRAAEAFEKARNAFGAWRDERDNPEP